MSGPISERILLHVEDDDATAYLFLFALQRTDSSPRLFRVKDGAQALAFLFRQEPYTDAPTPDLVVLDLNLPRKSGFEVLAEMKNDPLLQDIPVVICSTSLLPDDRARSIKLGAENYLPKGIDFDAFVNIANWVCGRIAAPAESVGLSHAARAS